MLVGVYVGEGWRAHAHAMTGVRYKVVMSRVCLEPLEPSPRSDSPTPRIGA